MNGPPDSGRRGQARRAFRSLLRLLPFEMRADHGDEMELDFRDQHREASSKGAGAVRRLWIETVWDLARTAPRENLEMLGQDLAFALRLLRRNPGFTAVAVLTLALGLGANTAVFSLVEAVLLRPLPYPEAARLVRLGTMVPEEGSGLSGASLQDLEDWRAEVKTLDRIAGYQVRSGALTSEGIEAQRVRFALTSAELFDALGVHPLHGRLFAPGEDAPGRDRVVLVSHGFWRGRMGGDPSAVGSTLTLDGEILEVVGVLPPGVEFPVEAPCDLWKPIGLEGDQAGARDGRWLTPIARRAPEVSPAAVRQEMAAVAARLAVRYPETNRGVTAVAEDLRLAAVRDSRALLITLSAAVVLVLLIVCANTANLLLARGSARRAEMALRASLGARQGRLLRQLLTESLLLALAGGLLGAGLAAVAVRALPRLLAGGGGEIPRLEQAGLDPAVLGFTFALALLTGVVCGLVPALRLSASAFATSLRAAGRGAGTGGHRGRRVLVAAEVALAMVVLVGAGLVLRSFRQLTAVEPGFRTEGVLTLRVEPPWEVSLEDTPPEELMARFAAERRRVDALYSRVLDGVRNLPGVESVAGVNRLPLSGNAWAVYVFPEPQAGEAPHRVIGNSRVVTEDFFSTLSIPRLEGRLFDGRDTEGSPPAVVVSRALAETFWPGESPLGKRLTTDNPERGEALWSEVVGVVEDLRHIRLDQPTAPVVYRVLAQCREGFFQDWGMDLVLRTRGEDPAALAPAVRRSLASTLPGQPAFRVRTLEEVVAGDLAVRRFGLVLLALFAGSALLLAVVGLHGVLAYTVSRRTREMGLRLALGASPRRILLRVIAQGMLPVAVGLAAGAGLAAVAAPHLQALLFEVRGTDPLTFAATAAVLLAVALAACYLPARRATRVDPVTALRQD